MRSGKLRHRIKLQEATTEPNEFGEPVETWSTYATVWGRVSPLEGSDRWAAQQVNAEVTHEVEIRWSDDVSGMKAEHRVRFGDRTLMIAAPYVPDERRRNIILPCSEEVE